MCLSCLLYKPFMKRKEENGAKRKWREGTAKIKPDKSNEAELREKNEALKIKIKSKEWEIKETNDVRQMQRETGKGINEKVENSKREEPGV